MFIFGTQGTTDTRKRGTFYCPSCQSQQSYKLQRVRQAFSLFFIPVLPLNEVGQYVECQKCKDTFKPAVLEYDPESAKRDFEAAWKTAMRQVMTATMVVNGSIEEKEIRTVQGIYRQLTGTELDEATCRREASELAADPSAALQQLTKLAGSLNDHGKELALKAAYLVAASDGEVGSRETTLIGQIGQQLGMTRAHVKGVLTSLSEAA